MQTKEITLTVAYKRYESLELHLKRTNPLCVCVRALARSLSFNNFKLI